MENDITGSSHIESASFYPSAHKGYRGIVFTNGVRICGQVGGRAGGGKKFVQAVSQKLKV